MTSVGKHEARHRDNPAAHAIAPRQAAVDAVEETSVPRRSRHAKSAVEEPIPQRHRRRPGVVDVEGVDLPSATSIGMAAYGVFDQSSPCETCV
jgi:hypothetical protein